MTGPNPHLYTIPAGVPFAENFAAKLLQQYQDNPEKLAEILVLLPTRRACRIVRDSFLRQSGGVAMLLPRLQTIGDVDDDALGLEMAALAIPGSETLDIPPAISPMQRRMILTSLILKWPNYAGHPDQALALADALGQLLDRVHTEGLDMAALPALVDESGLAERWKLTLAFLSIVLQNWPSILAERGCIDAADRRNRLLLALAAHWQNHPPAHPVYAAGSTGSIPAVGQLLQVIAGLPQGTVILPGLDTGIDPASWDAIDDTHPQATLKTLLQQFSLMPWDIPLWDPHHPAPPRTSLAREMMRPAATTASWQNLARHPERVSDGLKNLQQITCHSAEEEAALVALIFRHVQHQPGKTAALVTFDRGLARRVAGACARWGLRIDDSAGQFLNTTPIGSYLEFCVETCVQHFAPVPLLSLLKHNHAAAGMEPGDYRGAIRRLDKALRGLRPAPGIAGLKAHCRDDLWPFLAILEQKFTPLLALCDGQAHPFEAFLQAHLSVAEALADTPEQKGAARLWAAEEGEEAAGFLADLIAQAAFLPAVDGGQYIRMLNTLMRGVQVRPNWGTHPRLSILGPMEARMLQADLVILGGLNEGSWPGTPEPDPWMSRPMRHKFGLPSPERSVGLSAHDFVQAFSVGEVILTRAARSGSAPTIPSRWLQRLDAVLSAAGATMIQTDWLEKLRQRDRPAIIAPALRPAPAPPADKRPVRLSVTEIETWMRDPYSVYAKRVLNLYKLDLADESMDAADRGTLLHEILETFIRTYKDSLPEDAEQRLLDMGHALLDERIKDVRARHFWGIRFENMAKWLVSQERTWRTKARPLILESKGEMTVPGTGFTLSGKADRIDRMLGGDSDGHGSVAIIDYKTGAVPKGKDVLQGLSPQLPLEAAMIRLGAFPGIPAGTDVGFLTHWVVNGNREGGREVAIKDDPEQLADDALDGLTRLVSVFSDPATPYMSLPRPAARPRYNDYAQLARVQEWVVLDDVADGGGE